MCPSSEGGREEEHGTTKEVFAATERCLHEVACGAYRLCYRCEIEEGGHADGEVH